MFIFTADLISLTPKFNNTASDKNTHHQTFATIYDAHLFDFRFRTVTGTVGGAVAANTSVVRLKGSGADSFPTVNCLFGCSVTVNTSFLGVTTSDTRKIIKWTGSLTATANKLDLSADGTEDEAAAYHAVLESPLSQPTTATSTYSINFGVKDLSLIHI